MITAEETLYIGKTDCISNNSVTFFFLSVKLMLGSHNSDRFSSAFCKWFKDQMSFPLSGDKTKVQSSFPSM